MFQPLPNAPSEPMVVDVNSYPVDTLENGGQGGLQSQSEAAGAEEFQSGGRLDRQTSTTSLAEFATSKQVRPSFTRTPRCRQQEGCQKRTEHHCGDLRDHITQSVPSWQSRIQVLWRFSLPRNKVSKNLGTNASQLPHFFRPCHSHHPAWFGQDERSI